MDATDVGVTGAFITGDIGIVTGTGTVTAVTGVVLSSNNFLFAKNMASGGLVLTVRQTFSNG